jgi:hypothetical protein
MKKIFVSKDNDSMVWFGAMPNTVDSQIEKLEAMGYTIVMVTGNDTI